MMTTNIIEKIISKEASVGIVGMGYVGLPLAMAFAQAGFKTYGIDINSEKIEKLKSGISYIEDISSGEIKAFLKSGKFIPVSDYEVIRELDVVIICVPTPLNKTKDPDVSYIISVCDEMEPRLHKEMLIILESTTYPGFTREVIVSRIERLGFKVGEDIWVAFSPERVDPGNKRYNIKNTPKVIGGATEKCLNVCKLLYQQVIDRVISVSSTDCAEMVKLLENTFRAVNIGLVNEIAVMCKVLGLDTWEVIEAASTKPFGFMPFYPGPGLGGHCIPIDPHYLSWKLKTLKYNARFIELAGEINSNMPKVVVEMVVEALNREGKPVNGTKILVIGVAYKRDVNDVRESPALDIIELLKQKGGVVSYYDPHVPSLEQFGIALKSQEKVDYSSYDCVVIVTDHTDIDWGEVVEKSKLIIDTRNATKEFRKSFKDKIITL